MISVKKIIIYLSNYFYTRKETALKELSDVDYYDSFIKGRKDCEIKETYIRAWEAKNFEIYNYWKRANYFWAFQVASFAGYFSVYGSKYFKENTEVLYCLICIGFITGIAWSLINKGSKAWQRNWESHVVMLEDWVTGPLYKTVSVSNTFSVSKINEIVSHFISVVWIILGIKYFTNYITFEIVDGSKINLTVILSSVFVIYFTGAMFFGYGRGRFGKRKSVFFTHNNK